MRQGQQLHKLRSRLGLLCAVATALLADRPALAQLNLSGGQRAADGTVYEVIAVNNGALQGGVDQMRITTVAGSPNSLVACSSGGGGPGQPTSALSGADPLVPQVLHNYHSVTRSGVLSPNNLTISFNPDNAGRLTIGTGAGAIEICRDAAGCAGGASDAGIFPLSSSAGSVPSACIATGVTATPCAGSAAVTTFAFGLPSSGDPPFCSGVPTTLPSVCAPPPSDGFTVGKGQVVVFIYNHSLAMSGFTYGAGGFGIDIDSGPICGTANRIVTADGQAPSAPPPIHPTPVVSATPTATPSKTVTASPTPTATVTSTASRTPTTTPTPTQTPSLTPTPCGNHVINPGEQCDDGNKVNGDGCDNNCTFTSCGNGMLTTGEVCDDGNLMSGDGCDSNCKPTGCGNGIVTAPEGCDDGNLVSGDGCDSNCRPTGCGNGVVTPPEQCDDGNFVNGDGCDNDCKAPVCGDGVVRAPEQCDDHNLIDGDGCDHNCRLTGCGNGVVSTPEACDDGNMIDGDGCEHNCTLTACGPGGVGTIPGYCGSRANDCEAEFCVPGFPQISAKSLPTNILRCKEGDPSCDATSGDGVCTFRFALCYNVDDHRIPCAKTGRIERVSFRRPSESAPRGRYNIANRDAIEAALVAIGGVVKGKCHNGGPKKGTVCGNDAACDNPTGSGNGVCVSRQVMFSPLLTTPNVCTPLLSFKVPLRVVHSGVASGRTDVRIRAYGPKPDKKDGDILKFFCLP